MAGIMSAAGAIEKNRLGFRKLHNKSNYDGMMNG